MLDDKLKQKAEFYIAGEGELENELKQLNKNFDAGIIFLGSLRNIYKTLSETDVLIFPSRSANEGFPAIITEAGANNNLVITSAFSALGNMIENNINGLVFSRDDEEKLSGMLASVIENSENYKPMAGKFYNKIKKLFSIDEMITKHSKLYYECLS